MAAILKKWAPSWIFRWLVGQICLVYFMESSCLFWCLYHQMHDFSIIRPTITFPIDYHWECVRGHCACAESRDPWVRGHKQLHIWNPRPRFAYSLYKFYLVTMTIKGRLLSRVTNAEALDCVNFLCVTFDLLIFNIYHTWRVTWSTLPPSLKTLRLFVHE